MKAQKLFCVAALASIALALAACGGAAESESNEITVVGNDDFTFAPATLTVTAGQEYVLTFQNVGSVEHTFNILNADAELEHVLEEIEEEHIHEELYLEFHAVGAGESATETFTAPTEPGDYVIVCLVPGHAEAGMVGTLTVTP